MMDKIRLLQLHCQLHPMPLVVDYISLECIERWSVVNVACDCICDQACKNQPCECKLHLVRYSCISSVLKEVFSFCKL